mmetsp:Transcript_33040/g.99532  ORF Transcript_33040/g.99532 Transcript_33040/m.99532 type:complete len:234 (+) Transcript_33040:456-1157(+)
MTTTPRAQAAAMDAWYGILCQKVPASMNRFISASTVYASRYVQWSTRMISRSMRSLNAPFTPSELIIASVSFEYSLKRRRWFSVVMRSGLGCSYSSRTAVKSTSFVANMLAPGLLPRSGRPVRTRRRAAAGARRAERGRRRAGALAKRVAGATTRGDAWLAARRRTAAAPSIGAVTTGERRRSVQIRGCGGTPANARAQPALRGVSVRRRSCSQPGKTDTRRYDGGEQVTARA